LDPSSFTQGQMSETPAADPTQYVSGDPATIDRQVIEAQHAGIDAFIASWQGIGSTSDANLPAVLTSADAHNFKVALYFETNLVMQDPQTRMGDMAAHLRAALKYQDNPAYLKWNGHPVVFFWRTDLYGDANAWTALRKSVDPNNDQIWSVDTGDPTQIDGTNGKPSLLDAFDGIHVFASAKYNATTDVANNDKTWRNTVDGYNAKRPGAHRLWAAGVIPGWDESHALPPRPDAKVFPRRDGALYTETWQGAIASNPEWITITSYNEWFEGTQIEPSVTYSTKYLDMTKQFVDQWKATTEPPATPNPNDPCVGGTSYPQTGHSICKKMTSYWQQYGGLAQFGYPISDPLVEKSPTDGKSYTVQYFQRARFELHPENTDPRYQVLLGLLGTQCHVGEPPAPRINDGQHYYFAETGHNVSALFYTYWQAHGGLFVNGFPISEAFSETSPTDHKPYTVQYFQRERYEAHPENQPPYDALLGLLGVQAWAQRGP
jgi:hypothetical protein